MVNFKTDDLAPYACHDAASIEREHREPLDPLRSPFAFDRHRIIGCTAFRRLEGKTQVFAPSAHDHFRTRLTHTIEGSHIARTLARTLRVDEDLSEAITLAHDLGHPPFGHAGESALADAMKHVGGFNHNLHALRVVEFLEHPFPAFRGLNLTAATRDGLASHVTGYDVAEDATLKRTPSVEGQISSLADRVAYNCHDLEDAIGAGFVGAKELASLDLWQQACSTAKVDAKTDSIHAIRRPVLDALLAAILTDAVKASMSKLQQLSSLADVARTIDTVVVLSKGMEKSLGEVERFLLRRVYRRAEVARSDAEGRKKIGTVFEAFRKNPNRLPRRFAARIDAQGLDRVVCDYIAGMTDRFCEAVFDEINSV